MAKRMIETNLTEEDVKIEGSLRPQVLEDYIGQSKVKQTLKIYIEAARGGMPWIMCCFTALQVWARPL